MQATVISASILEAPEQEPETIKPAWQDCRDALKSAMEADNPRPSNVADS